MDLSEWNERISKRGIAFFKFIEYWTSYVLRIMTNNLIPWQDIPGYVILIKAVLYEVKIRKVTNYPEALKEACCALLANENILTILVNIIFKKTSVYDYQIVNASLDFVIFLFKSVHHRYKKSMPSSFDFQFFFKGCIK